MSGWRHERCSDCVAASPTTRVLTVQAFHTLLSVSIFHDYFEGGQAQQMVFRPDEETSQFLLRFGLPRRGDGHGFTLLAGTDQLDLLWSERLNENGAPRALVFELRCMDPACAYYTDTGDPPLPCRYEPDAQAPQTLVPTMPPMLGMASLRSRCDGPGMLLGEVALPFNPRNDTSADSWKAGLGTAYRLQFTARKTVWKYLLLGDWQEHQLRLVDLQSRIQFSAPAIEPLADGRSATVIRSTNPIQLQERPSVRFQLRDAASTPEKVLIPRLPAAEPHRLLREEIDGVATTVSELFVNR